MNDHVATVMLSTLDEQHFGIRTARATGVTALSLPMLLHFCETNTVELLIARCSTYDLDATQAMERHGFALMDTLLYFTHDLQHILYTSQPGALRVRSIRPAEADTVQAIARAAFRCYHSHYHADPRLDPLASDEVYAEWAYQAARSRTVADEVLVAELNGAIVGFGTLRLSNDTTVEGGLFAVCPTARRQGVYRSIMIHALEWCTTRGASQMLISTQVTNLASQKVWTRLAFEPCDSFYTFHKWFTQ
ncbi:MAG: GNAT family N-acetyltransferase [Herpetosiphonaceae bacterium]|nr:GNAT family N-acetyltransferase [Herpetosiphonaceae bacterium]